ncbi:F-box protein At2g02240-like [Syzygium oleosum]|uniref:F-box protein At2g02240-like n=1 Tax=Syzygium oleosum TaxID=219896 RepID=UPI0011D259F9|nr:F-box protein At2g02240-like [Syzygium oleosum]
MTEAKRRDGPDFSALPEGCIASVVSFTSPPDACRLASVSPIFKSACDSDAVWASFLPPDWRPMVSRSTSSLKELYFSLCDDPVLVGDGKMSFSLDRHSGKKCIMLSARALSITGGDTPSNWSWNHMPNSRFAEVAELMEANRLEIRGTISPRMLSPRTLYAAYLVFKLTLTHNNGFELRLFEVGAGFAGDEVGKRERYVQLSRTKRSSGPPRRRHCGVIPLAPDEGDGSYPKERRDGWSEIELGEFLTEDGQDGEVAINVLDTRSDWRMVGLVVEGIEIRPKDGK